MVYRRTALVEEQLADRRARILSAARRLVAEAGFREAQIAPIAEAAGIAVGTVYRYFPSKADLFSEVVAITCEREVGVCAAIAETDGPPAEKLADAIGAFARRAVQGKRMAFALIAEPVEPAVEAVRLQYRRALGQVMERIVTEGVDCGAFPPQEAGETAACLVGAVIEGLVGPLAPDARSLEDGGEALIEAITRFCLRAVIGRDGSLPRLVSDP